jgi:hypothetical protein
VIVVLLSQDLVNIQNSTPFKKALKTFLFKEHYGSALTLRPCIINSMFRDTWPWGPEIHARALPTQHKLDFQHITFLIIDVCWNFVLRIFTILKNRWAMHFPLGEPSGQNRTRNIESNTHGLTVFSRVSALQICGCIIIILDKLGVSAALAISP